MSREDVTGRAIRAWSRLFPDEDLIAYEVMLRLIRGGRIAENALVPGIDTEGVEVPGDYEVLATLRRSHPEPLRPVTIASRVMVSPPGLTGRLDRLEQAGLVARHPHPSDRRATHIRLTDRGIDVADGAFTAVLDEMRRLTTRVSPRELRAAAGCLQGLLVALGDEASTGEATA